MLRILMLIAAAFAVFLLIQISLGAMRDSSASLQPETTPSAPDVSFNAQWEISDSTSFIERITAWITSILPETNNRSGDIEPVFPAIE